MRTIYFPDEKVQVFVAESAQDRQVMNLSAGLSSAKGKLAINPAPFHQFFSTDPRSFFADNSVATADPRSAPTEKDAEEPKVFSGDAPPQADTEPRGPGMLVAEAARRAMYRYHDLIVNGRAQAGQFGQAVRRFIHSEWLAVVVKLSPTPADDVILELLRTLVPPPDAKADSAK